MAATPQNVEMEAAKFLHKLIQESKDEPTKLATKLHVILQHMRSSGKENSMPYQVISRAMETVINRHGLDMEALMSSRPPLSSGTQPGDSPLSQIAGPSQQTAVENDSKKPLATEDTTKIATFSKPLHGSSSAGHDIYQGSANQLNSIKNHGSNAGFSGSYESAEPGNPLSMQFSNSYDNQSAATLMHKSPAGKALDYEGGFPNVIANASKTVQGGISNNIAEASRDTGKLPVVQATPAGPSMPFKEHHLKQLRAQCLVFLAFRNNLMPKKLHLEIALGNFFSKEDPSSKEHIDQKGKEQSIGGQSSGFISETNLLKEGDKIDRMMDKSEPTYGEGMRNNPIPRKVEAEMPVFEAKESQTSATRVPQSDPSNIALHADSQGNRHGHNSHLPSWKPHSGMEGERHMVVQKTANILEKDVILAGNKHEGEDTSELSTSPASPKYTTSEKWIADCQKRKVAADNNWAVKKMKTEQRISACVDKLKETVSSSEDISAKTRSVIELKKLELLNLQRRLRNDILKNYFRPISNEMDRLKSIKKSRIGRRSKQLERYEQKMKEERQKRIRERQKDFFGEMEMHKERLEDVHKFRRERAKGFNKYVREFHKKKERLYREKIDRIQREKINLLKINDVEGYLRMVKDAKSDRVKQLLKETEKYLQKLGSKLKEAKVISRCFETDNGVNDSSEFTIENEDETDQAKHYMESNEKYYMMAHSVKEIVAEQPATLIGGKLREYQMNGLRWLLSLYNNHLNGILADEMGLGKTVQVISLLCYLMENKNDRGPFLVVVPSSVLPGWESEINFWAPTINKIVYSGHPEERRKLFKEKIVQQKFNVLLTTYEYLMNKHDRPKLSKIHWHYVIIDEGHRIKNASCKLNAELKHYHSSHRLLLTGTPLQNNLEELWALLNFLLPNIFNSAEDFSQWFNKPFESNADNSLEEALLSEEENLLIINRLHQVLRPFVLRRLKHKVENELPEKIERLVRCESSAYQKILMQRVEDNMGAFGASKSRGVHNTVVELRNICNHPYLSQLHTEQVHDFLPKHFLPNVIRFCGKLEMLDRLLPKLKATDHRVLLFSTMTRLLDVMEDYLYWKQYKYLRLDGHTHGGDRGSLIDQFNKPGSPFFIFLLSIRAGGVGVNLQAADTVIIFDTDWNPQVDLQAQARAHRIGQKKDVLVLRLETVKSVEEQVRASAEHKLGVANQSITAGFFDNNTSAEDRREYLEALLRECKKEEAAPVLNDDGLNDLIARSESEIDVFEELDKKRQEEELALWKKVVSEQGGTSGEFVLPPLPSRLVTEDDMKSFCEAMKAIEVPKPVILPGIAGKRKSELGNLDTHNYGRGKRAREVRSYEEQWTEDEFEKMCQVEAAPDSPKEEDLGIVKAESAMVITNIQPLQIEANPPSKRGRGRPPKKKPPGIGVPPPTFHPLGMQIVPSPSVSVSNPTDTLSLPPTTNPTLSVPPGFQPTTASPPPPGFPPTDPPPGYKPITAPPPGYQPLSTPPGYQPIAPPPPGFQPIIPSSSPSTTASLSTSQPTTINSPPLLHITTPATQPTDTLPSPDSQSADTSPSATSGRGRGRGRGGRGRGRGRSRGQGRGRGRIFESGVDEPQRRVIIESGVDERQRRGRKPHHVVLAIPGFRTLNNPQAASPPVSETANELSVSNPSSAINAASHKPLVETFKSDIPSHPAKPVSGLPNPDIPTTSPLLSVASQATPLQVSVASQATPPQVSVASQAMLPPVSAGSETMAPPVPVGSEAMPSTIPVGSEAMPSPVPVGLETTPPPGPVGSEATRSPVPVGSETMPPPVLVGSQATPPPVSVGSQAPPPVPVDSQTPVPPVSVDLQATQPPVCVDSQAAPPPVSVGSQATTPPVCVDSQATTPPVSVNSQATTPLVSEASPPAVPVSYQATVPLPVSVDSQATAPSVSTDSQATAPLVSVGSEATPPPVPVSSQATVPLPVSVGSEATTPPVSVSFEATEVGNSSPASAGLKQSRGRGRKVEASTPRRRERKKVDSEENETPQKKTRASTGRKSVATRSMLRNEAQKMIDKASDDSAPIPQESNTSPQKDISVEAAAKTDDAVQKEDLDPKPCKEADQATKDNETQVEQQATKDNETLVEQQATKDNETQVTVAEKDVQIAEENVGETVEANPVEENVADVQIGTESAKEQGANDTNKASPELDTMQEAEEGKIEKEEVVVAQGSGNEDPHDDSGNPT